MILISYEERADSPTSEQDLGHLQLPSPATGHRHLVIFYADRGAGKGNSYNSVYVNFTREINFKVVATPSPGYRLPMECRVRDGDGKSELMAPQAVANAFVSLKVTGGRRQWGGKTKMHIRLWSWPTFVFVTEPPDRKAHAEKNHGNSIIF